MSGDGTQETSWPPLAIELTVKQLLEMPEEGQRLAGATINLLWEAHCGGRAAYYADPDDEATADADFRL